ncbi:hypothetical protein [Helicobacter sp. 11S02629-2]|uniref:hypothetical protein n=1 Tax=Helicobacter sp. 11S02629-2 TaxID=1476195 RepID=UPI000BA6B667|nr:hypothetical protein [Helicobacter sp. 11S02629-2]PAF42738.1 hypothetical protein BKH40_07535 [Helicobacter sp. 11S02629-2]
MASSLTKTEATIFISLLETKELTNFFVQNPMRYFSEDGKKVYEALARFHRENKDFDIYSLKQYLSASIMEDILKATTLKTLSSVYERLAFEYKLRKQGEIAKKLYDASKQNKIIDIAQDMEEMNFSVYKYKTLGDVEDELRHKPTSKNYETGVNFFDISCYGGIKTGQLVLIGGDPEAGKTSLGVQIIERLSQVVKTCFLPLEFPMGNTYPERFPKLKAHYGANYQNLRDNLIVLDDFYSLQDIYNHIINLSTQGVRFFLIDSQMRVETNGINQEERETIKFKRLGSLARQHQVTIFFIVQNPKSGFGVMGSKLAENEADMYLYINKLKPLEHGKAKRLPAGENDVYDRYKRLITMRKNKQTGEHFSTEVDFDPKLKYFHKSDILDFKTYRQLEEEQRKKEEAYLEQNKEEAIFEIDI